MYCRDSNPGMSTQGLTLLSAMTLARVNQVHRSVIDGIIQLFYVYSFIN